MKTVYLIYSFLPTSENSISDLLSQYENIINDLKSQNPEVAFVSKVYDNAKSIELSSPEGRRKFIDFKSDFFESLENIDESWVVGFDILPDMTDDISYFVLHGVPVINLIKNKSCV